VYRPQPKRRRTDPSLNPLWARYMQHQDGGTGSQYLCRPQMPAASSGIGVVSPPVSSLSSAIDRAKLKGQSISRGK